MDHSFLRYLIGFALLFLAPWQAVAMEFEEARHLLNRTGFVASYEEIRKYQAFDYEEAVARLLDESTAASTEPLLKTGGKWKAPSRVIRPFHDCPSLKADSLS